MCSPSIRIAAETSLPLFFNNYRRTDNVAGGTKEGKKSGFLRAAARQQQQPQQSWVLQGDQLCPEERNWISSGRLATLGMSVCFVQWGKNPLHPVEEAKWLMAGFEKLARSLSQNDAHETHHSVSRFRHIIWRSCTTGSSNWFEVGWQHTLIIQD